MVGVAGGGMAIKHVKTPQYNFEVKQYLLEAKLWGATSASLRREVALHWPLQDIANTNFYSVWQTNGGLGGVVYFVLCMANKRAVGGGGWYSVLEILWER